MSTTDAAENVGGILLRFGPMIYGPTIVFSLGEGALIPLIPVIAHRLGATEAVAAAVAAGLVVGQLFGNIPAGWTVSRFGERASMAAGGAAALVGVLGVIFAPDLAVLALAVFVLGFCAAVFDLARQSFMTMRVPLAFRARALSLLGGSFRVGNFVGPFIAAGLLGLFLTEDAAIWFAFGCLAAVVLMVLFGPDPEREAGQALAQAGGEDAAADPAADTEELLRAEETEDFGEAIEPIPSAERVGSFRTMWLHRGVLARVGVAAAALSGLRAARQVLLPLWGVSIGVDAQTITVVVGVSGAIDFALFYASGVVMDRFGRMWAAVPAMLLMGGAFLAVSFTHALRPAELWFVLFAVVLGLGNGVSSGILLTVGADLAPRPDPAAFLGSWRTITDAGGALTPLLVSAVTACVSLPASAAVVGVIGLLGAGAFARWLPRYVPHGTRA